MKRGNVTALCLCTLIGAGFATGRELMSYFVNYGIYGFVGMAFSSIMFAIAVYLILKSPFHSIKELTKSRLPRAAAFAAEKTVILFLVVLFSGMLAASGEVFSLILGVDKNICLVVSALLCLMVIISGASAVAELSRLLFIPMAVIIFITGWALSGKDIALPPENILNINTLLSPFIYLSYNMISAAALIITLPKEENALNSAVETGFCIFILSVVLALPLYTHYSDVCSQALPVAVLLKGKGIVEYLYMLFLLAAIFTTAVSSGYSAVCHIGGSRLSAVVVVFSALAVSCIGFKAIVDKVYFLSGIMGILLLWCLLPKKRL